jgi:hypothetical protein
MCWVHNTITTLSVLCLKRGTDRGIGNGAAGDDGGTVMYFFIKTQYLLGHIDADKVRSYAPRWITTAQAEEIISLRDLGL